MFEIINKSHKNKNQTPTALEVKQNLEMRLTWTWMMDLAWDRLGTFGNFGSNPVK